MTALGTRAADAPWDLVVVGAGPAGAATALAARRADPDLRVLLLDRRSFPRDKACGDGVAPHVLDLLAGVGVDDLVDDRSAVGTLRLGHGRRAVERVMARPSHVVPREVLDARLVDAAVAAGARLRQHRIRAVEEDGDTVRIDGGLLTGRVVVGADGAYSTVARSLGVRPGPRALALRGYAPVRETSRGRQVVVFGEERQPSYAWSFDRGDGLANVGYGEVLGGPAGHLSRAELLRRLDDLLPGASRGGKRWRAHHLPLSTARPLRPGRGRVLLAGDAAGLVNPLTGEGIYYAVLTGLVAGSVAAETLRSGRVPGLEHQRRLRRLLGGHLRHTAVAGRLARSTSVLDAGITAAATDQRVFDDLVELGLARGHLTSRVLGGLARSSVRPAPPGRHRAPRGGTP